MSSSSDLVRRIFIAHAEHDREAFCTSAEELIADERRKNHHVFASELERILRNEMATPSLQTKSMMLLGMPTDELPRDVERGIVLVEIIQPRRSLGDLVLADSVRADLQRILNENRHSELLGSFGLKAASKFLFCGPPGCGKTVAAETIAQGLYLPLVLVRFDAVVSSYIGETAANLRKVFDFAQSRPMVMLFDEFDAIGKSRTALEEHGELKRVVNSFLQMLDGFKGSALMIAATNHQDLLDSALWRRFDEIVLFDKPDLNHIKQLLLKNFNQIEINPSTRLATRAKALVGMSHADIERIAYDSIKQSVLRNTKQIEPEVFEEAIQRQRKRVAITERNQTITPKRAKVSQVSSQKEQPSQPRRK